jgi:hypothetical protein
MSPHPHETMTWYMRPPDMAEAEVEEQVTILPPRKGAIKEKDQVLQQVQDVCNRKVDRTVEYSYTIMFHAVKSDALLLFSDHALSDGYSGMIVLHDVLFNIRILILQHHNVDSKDREIQSKIQDREEELLLRPLLYEQLRGP